MRKILLLALTCIFTFSSCEKQEDETTVPVVNIDVTGNFSILPEGGTQTVSYSVSNPVESGQTSASSSAAWITAGITDGSTVTLTAEANESGAHRSAIITVEYTYGDGQSVNAQINCIQDIYEKPLTFEINVTPSTSSASIDVIPSDNEAFYFISVLDMSFEQAGYSDEQILAQLLETYGPYLNEYALQGVTNGYVVSSMAPGTEYYAAAFGVDINTATATSDMTKVKFTTLSSQPTDAYVEGSISYWWSIDELTDYNPNYALFSQQSDLPALAAVDLSFNDDAVSCIYTLWEGTYGKDVYDDLYTQTMRGSRADKGDPASLYYISYDASCTLCVIAIDAEGNYGDMDMFPITFSYEGRSSDFGLFDTYYNRLTGAPARPVSLRK